MRPTRAGGQGKTRPAQASAPAQKKTPTPDAGGQGKQRPK